MGHRGAQVGVSEQGLCGIRVFDLIGDGSVDTPAQSVYVGHGMPFAMYVKMICSRAR